jgi:hypothetical protein
MMYITLPRKSRVDSKANLTSFYEVLTLFKRHGLGIAHFGSSHVAFYDNTHCKENTVPVSSYFNMTKKEFLIFVDIVNRLDKAEKKMTDCVKFVNTSR